MTDSRSGVQADGKNGKRKRRSCKSWREEDTRERDESCGKGSRAQVIRGVTAGLPSRSPAAVTCGHQGHVRGAQGWDGGGDRDEDGNWDPPQVRDVPLPAPLTASATAAISTR